MYSKPESFFETSLVKNFGYQTSGPKTQAVYLWNQVVVGAMRFQLCLLQNRDCLTVSSVLNTWWVQGAVKHLPVSLFQMLLWGSDDSFCFRRKRHTGCVGIALFVFCSPVGVLEFICKSNFFEQKEQNPGFLQCGQLPCKFTVSVGNPGCWWFGKDISVQSPKLGVLLFCDLILVTEEAFFPSGVNRCETAVSELMCLCNLFKN